ncbi:MAG TPA: type IV pilus secretin PilQ family protein, partial [Gammaproteobacteria bacterium]|nr:type IV pilus secretin PilQ family protein [Gammaproteobacteria bacterium]
TQAIKEDTGPFSGKLAKELIVEGQKVKNIDFRRGAAGEGRIIVDLSHPNIPIDFKEEGNHILVRFLGVKLEDRFARRLDVTDFGTPVSFVNVLTKGQDVEMQIETHGLTENVAYQADNRFSVEVKPLSKAENEKLKAKEKEYTGEKLSLNFQDIEVRAVLQLIADFTGLNVVTSDAVQGNVTLRLRNVPWDQALDIILKTRGLDKRQEGNVIIIGPSEELATRERQELQTNQQVEELVPLHSEYVQVNYAKAQEIADLLKAEDNSLLSSRGKVSVDPRTNTLLVQDTGPKLNEIRQLVHRLDIPIRQVLIDARIVFANDDFQRSLGVNLGTAEKFRIGQEPVLGLTGNATASNTIATGGLPSATSVANRLHFALAPTLTDNPLMGHFGMTIAKLPVGTILDLELSALESEGLGKIVGSPRLVTSNQQTAYIEAGEEIPYLESTSSGAAAIAFKKAALRLEVTPLITPDDNIILTLLINQDSRGKEILPGGAPPIDTQEIKTQVLVGNGRTLVLGGIYKQTKTNTVNRIPFFGRLPYVGWAFRSNKNVDQRSELMIFVTPKIIQDGLA